VFSKIDLQSGYNQIQVSVSNLVSGLVERGRESENQRWKLGFERKKMNSSSRRGILEEGITYIGLSDNCLMDCPAPGLCICSLPSKRDWTGAGPWPM
jgi:hypothetical protein